MKENELSASQKKILSLLKKRYCEKYIYPLSKFFTKPPIKYDRYQIILRKQIEKSYDDLDQAELCSLCLGNGTVVNKIDLRPEDGCDWKSLLPSTNGDARAVSVDICHNCFGHGIVFPLQMSVGSMIRDQDLDYMKCSFCDNYLEDTVYTKENTLFTKCQKCKLQYCLEPIGFRVDRIKYLPE